MVIFGFYDVENMALTQKTWKKSFGTVIFIVLKRILMEIILPTHFFEVLRANFIQSQKISIFKVITPYLWMVFRYNQHAIDFFGPSFLLLEQ